MSVSTRPLHQAASIHHCPGRPVAMSVAAVLVLVFVTVTIGASAAFGEPTAEPELEIWFGETYCLEGDTGITIDVHVKNFRDSLAGFEIWFRMDRPDFVTVRKEIDIANTLVAGWQYFDIRTVDSSGFDVKVSGIADLQPPYSDVFIPPQDGTTPLFRLKVDRIVPPSPYSTEARVSVIPYLQHFGFATPPTPVSRSLGISSRQQPDTIYYQCLQWIGDSCAEWQEVSSQDPWDSVEYVTETIYYVDPEKVILHDGWIYDAPAVCGDIDGSYDGQVSLGDLTTMIDHLFVSFTPLLHPELGNVDSSPDGEISLGDLTVLLDHLFVSFDPLDCGLTD